MSKYIGKRIVPRHDGEWDKSQAYEGLVIVLDPDTGDSYTSRKAVPAGIELSNTEYWARSGAFNAQLKATYDGIAADNDATEAAMKEDNDATEKAIKAYNDATEAAVKEDNAATKKYVEESVAAMTEATENAVDLTTTNRTELEARMVSIETRQDANVTASTDANADYAAEVVDARVDSDGKTHGSLGDAIRYVISELSNRKQDCLGRFEQISSFESVEGTLFNSKRNVEFTHNGSMYSKYSIPAGTTFVKASGYQWADKQYSPITLLDAAGNILSYYEGDVLGYVTVVVPVPKEAEYAYVNGRISTDNPDLEILEKADASEVLVLPEKMDAVENDVASLTGQAQDLESRIEVYEEMHPSLVLAVGLEKRVYDVDIEGYVDYTDGSYHKYGNGDYLCSDYISVIPGAEYHAEVTVQALAGICFYDRAKQYLSGINSLPENKILDIPADAKYLRVSDYVVNTVGQIYSVLDGRLDGIDSRLDQVDEKIALTQERLDEQILDGKHRLTINCIGDSVTEGMSLTGAHYARYGESPYPARLQTLLTDNGYTYVTVNNYGHGGERTADIAARLGGLACFISEDIVIPADNQKVSLGTMVKENGHVVGTKIKVPYPDANGEDYCVYITQTSHDTNPVNIDGVEYTMTVSNGADWIAKTVADGKETTIPEGALFFTANDRSGTVNILYGGINDGAELTFVRWANMMEACGEVNGGKYIVLGCTHALFNNWADIEGDTLADKFKYYHRKCTERFGPRFIDLYDEFARHGLDYAISAGYLQDESEEAIEEMRVKLSAHIIPGQFCYDGNDGNVHLSEAGYHVVAMLVFERLKLLNYI